LARINVLHIVRVSVGKWPWIFIKFDNLFRHVTTSQSLLQILLYRDGICRTGKWCFCKPPKIIFYGHLWNQIWISELRPRHKSDTIFVQRCLWHESSQASQILPYEFDIEIKMIIKIRIVRIKSRGSILLKEIIMIKSATLYMFNVKKK